MEHQLQHDAPPETPSSNRTSRRPPRKLCSFTQMLDSIVQKLQKARCVILSTHRHSDGDGLGAQTALFHGLRKLGIKARMVNVDRPSAKYSFMGLDGTVEVFEPGRTSLDGIDLALILDTNDCRLVEPLYSELITRNIETLFIDHHPILANAPQPIHDSLVAVGAASTGELGFRLLKKLGVELDAQIARALYTSLVFDTHLFRYVKSDPASHLMAAELLKYERHPEEVHHHLFSTYTVSKMNSLMRSLARVEYSADNRVAFIPFPASEHSIPGNLERDESGDLIDHVMKIGSVEVAALLREDGPEQFKLSLRSRGNLEVLSVAESFGGGGHKYASGAYLTGTYENLRREVLEKLERLVPTSPINRSAGP